MKPRDVQRAVRSSRIDRVPGDAPSIGRVSRVPGTGLPKGVRRRRRRGSGGKGNRDRRNRRMVVMTWSTVLGLVTLGATVFALVVWLKSVRKQSADAGPSGEAPVVQERVVSRFESPSDTEALSIVKRALAVEDPYDVPRRFRMGTASAAGVLEILKGMGKTEGPVTGMDWLSSMDANGLLIEGVLVNTAMNGNPRNRLALLTPDEHGTWKVDFDAFARTSKPAIEELLKPDCPGGTVRVIVAMDSYYNAAFADDRKWQCYGMVSPDSEALMFGYCRRDSAQAEAMKQIVMRRELSENATSSLKRATMELKRVQGGTYRQFEITRVVAEGWVASDRNFDESYR